MSRNLKYNIFKYSGIAGLITITLAIIICEMRLQAFQTWELHQMAISQYGYWPETTWIFCPALVIMSVLLMLFGIHLIDKFDLKKSWAFILTYFAATISGVLAGIFPMEIPYVDDFFKVKFTIHHTFGSALVLFFSFAIAIFGLQARKRFPRIGNISLVLGALSVGLGVLIILATKSAYLTEMVAGVFWGIWIIITTLAKKPAKRTS